MASFKSAEPACRLLRRNTALARALVWIVSGDSMFRRLQPQKGTLDDISRIEGLVRDRFRIDPADIVLVSQDHGTKPGFPPLETNVIFWKGDKRYRLKIFAPAAQVTDGDLPVDWLLPVLEDTGEAGCC